MNEKNEKGEMSEQNDQSEEKFVAFVQQAARNYNDADANIPRDEMWAAITLARRNAAQAKATRRRYLWAAAGMAATLVLGVAIGRYAGTTESPEASQLVVVAPSIEGGVTAYDIATLAHLSRAEALLVSYTTPTTAAPRGVQVDSALSQWAHTLLSNTRLLLDSPVATDERRRRILEDLERVLVQMVQVSPAETDADIRAHVERSLERTRIMSRLRSMQSATPVSGS
jgi:hypothetical protein